MPKPDITNWPRVTEILKVGGFYDLSYVNQDVLERASFWGKAVHSVCLYNDLSTLKEDSVDPALKPCLDGWRKFRTDNTWAKKIILAEEQLYSQLYGFKGTPDRLFKGGYLLDIKTGQQHKGQALQLAAYALMAEELKKIKITHRYTLILPEEGNYKLIEHKSDLDKSRFLACLTLYRYKQE